jgi:hypothetical protein
VAESEQKVYVFIAFGEQQFKMLAYVAKQRAQLERSFRTAIADMKQSQQERHARQPQPAMPAPAPVHEPAEPRVSPPDYVMTEGTESHPAFCSPLTQDTR